MSVEALQLRLTVLEPAVAVSPLGFEGGTQSRVVIETAGD